MEICHNKLWMLMIDKNMKKKTYNAYPGKFGYHHESWTK